jgi:hypothetical protein
MRLIEGADDLVAPSDIVEPPAKGFWPVILMVPVPIARESGCQGGIEISKALDVFHPNWR